MTELPFLDHGLVRVRDTMPAEDGDIAVINAAKVSFNERVEKIDEKGIRLINFLAKNGHWSPFAHPQISLELYLPGMVLDQLVKHRIGMIYSDEESFVAYENAADNQLSMRYKEPVHFYIPDKHSWREAPENKKQGSGPGCVEWQVAGAFTANLRSRISDAVYGYENMIANGVAPEQARLILPYYAMYTRRYWTSSLMGIIRFLQLREKPDAQYEIRELAGAVHRLILPRFPYSFRAYGLGEIA